MKLPHSNIFCMVDKVGVFKVTLGALKLTNHDGFKESNQLVLELGESRAVVKIKGTEVDLKHQVEIFKFTGNEVLKIRISEKENSDKAAYCEFKLEELAKTPGTIHHVKANLYLQEAKAVKGDAIGQLTLDLKYSNNLKRAILDVRVERAVLLRDTEVIGKMDPFVELKLGAQIRRTSVKDEAGKEPVWKEMYTIPVVNPLDPLKIEVKDEDVTTDDLVGSAQVDLGEKGMLAGTEWKEHVIELTFEGKKAGDLYLSTRYFAMAA